MHQADLRLWIEQVRSGGLPRRAFIAKAAALGFTAPMAAQLLMHAGIAQAQPASTYKSTRRGGGGALKLLWWQGPTLLNPHFATGTKDQEACRLFYEPLAVWDAEANLIPVLAAEIPTRANGGLAADGRSVTWKLKQGVTWHDGQPFTADDCIFTWQYARDPAAAAISIGDYKDLLRVEKIDSHTVKVVFNKPTPFFATAFMSGGWVVPKHLFSPYMGAKSREAPNNLKPVGTGPYKFVDFKPGDMVRAAINTNYHMPNRPYFDSVEMKGGGDATSAARTVLQTGEYDYAWNLLVEDEVLKRMEDGGKGRTRIVASGNVEFVLLNQADPWTEVDGERASAKSKHFAFSDPKVREAMALLIDRKGIQDFVYGRTGTATPNFVNAPAKYRSPNTNFEFNVEKANTLLDAAGWKKGADGLREKGGRKMKFVFQTSTNGNRQKQQAIIKQACQKAGIELELKAVNAGVFFSSDVGNPDTNTKFWADMEMYAINMSTPDPLALMIKFVSWEIASKANKWQGQNLVRWRNDEFDKLYRAAETELDPSKRAALFIRMNDLLIRENAVIPLVARSRVSGVANKLSMLLSPWDLDLAHVHDWFKEA
jgi:peptide/nickel transport system substrate-binding protein